MPDVQRARRSTCRGVDDDRGEHLTAATTDLFARHGLASAELAAIVKPELTEWAADARDRVCRRGLTIPRPVADFKDYDDERAAVRAALAGGGTVAIFALHGIGGAGKSELARKVAEEMAADFPDGQVFIDMLGTTRPRSAASPIWPGVPARSIAPTSTPSWS